MGILTYTHVQKSDYSGSTKSLNILFSELKLSAMLLLGFNFVTVHLFPSFSQELLFQHILLFQIYKSFHVLINVFNGIFRMYPPGGFTGLLQSDSSPTYIWVAIFIRSGPGNGVRLQQISRFFVKSFLQTCCLLWYYRVAAC
jgi:hypothetical protein